MKRILQDGKEKQLDSKNINMIKMTDHWINKDVIIVESINCIVPKFIENIMIGIDDKFKDTEFSIFSKSRYDKDRKLVVVDECYFIPKQSVSMAGVDYNEGPLEGYNTVIHKHPRGCRSFSETDDRYINQNHDFSLLWEGGSFVYGQMRFKTEFGLMKLKLNIVKPHVNINIEGLDKIERKVFKVQPIGNTINDMSSPNFPSSCGNRYIGSDYPHSYGRFNNVSEWSNTKKDEFLFPELSQVQSELDINEFDKYSDEIEDIMLREGVSWDAAVDINCREEELKNNTKRTGFRGI